MNKMKNTKGITLIALVITIIILIILAGIVINTLLGENSIIGKALLAKDKWKNSEEDESKKLEDLYSSILVANDGTVTLNMEDLKTIISSQVRKEMENIQLENGATPIGTIISYMGNTPPTGYLACDGTVYNIEDKKELAEQIKQEFGKYDYWGGDAVTTFAVPNLKGEFLRGTGTNSNPYGGAGASVGKHQAPTCIIDIYMDKEGKLATRYNDGKSSGMIGNGDAEMNRYNYQGVHNANLKSTVNNAVSKTIRPTNTAVLYCIKY